MRRLCSLIIVLVLLSAAVAAHASTFGTPRSRGGRLSQPASYGNFVFVPNGATIDIWNLADLAHPGKSRLDLTPDLHGAIQSIAVVGGDLFVAWSSMNSTDAAVRAYALDDPAHPAFVASIDGERAVALVAIGHYLYAIEESTGVNVFDVADAAHPVPTSHVDAEFDGIVSFASASNRFYVGDAFDSNGFALFDLFIFDTTDPAHPSTSGAIALGRTGAVGAATDDGHLVAMTDAGFTVLDVHDPAAIVPVFSTTDVGFTGATIEGSTLYTIYDPTIQSWDFSVPASPRPLVTQQIDDGVDAIWLTPFSAGLLYTTDYGDGYVLDVSNPSAIDVTANIHTGSSLGPFSAVRDDDTIYALADGYPFDVIDAHTMETVGAIDAGSADAAALGTVESILLDGHIVLAIGSPLSAIDVSNPARPTVVGSLDLFAVTGAFAGTHAYVSVLAANPVIDVVDVTDPAHMSVQGSLAADYRVLAASNGRIYAIDDNANPVPLYIIDATNPRLPRVAGRYFPCLLSAAATSIAISADANTIAVSCADGGVDLLDVLDPARPSLLGSVDAAADGVAIRNATLYAGTAFGVDAYDISHPAAPTLLGHFDTPTWVFGTPGGTVFSLSPNGGLLAATYSTGVAIFDCVSAPGPTVCGSTSAGVQHGHSVHARPAGR